LVPVDEVLEDLAELLGKACLLVGCEAQASECRDVANFFDRYGHVLFFEWMNLRFNELCLEPRSRRLHQRRNVAPGPTLEGNGLAYDDVDGALSHQALLFIHEPVRIENGHGHHRHTCLYGHMEGPFLQRLETAAVGTRALDEEQHGVTRADPLPRCLQATHRTPRIASVDENGGRLADRESKKWHFRQLCLGNEPERIRKCGTQCEDVEEVLMVADEYVGLSGIQAGAIGHVNADAGECEDGMRPPTGIAFEVLCSRRKTVADELNDGHGDRPERRHDGEPYEMEA